MYKQYYIKAKNLKTRRDERFIIRSSTKAFAIQQVDADGDYDELEFLTDKTYTTYAALHICIFSSTTGTDAIVHFGGVGRLWGLFERSKAT